MEKLIFNKEKIKKSEEYLIKDFEKFSNNIPTYPSLLSYISHLNNHNLPTTINKKIRVFRRVYGLDLDLLEEDKSYPILTQREINLLLKSAYGKYALRNRLIIKLLRDSGLTLQELANLNREDIAPRRGALLKIRNGEGIREVKLRDDTIETLKAYLSLFNPQISLFISNKGKTSKRLTPRGIQKILEKIGDRSGISKYKKVNAKIFRDTYIVNRLTVDKWSVIELKEDLKVDTLEILRNRKIKNRIMNRGFLGK